MISVKNIRNKMMWSLKSRLRTEGISVLVLILYNKFAADSCVLGVVQPVEVARD